MDRAAWRATVRGVTESQTGLSDLITITNPRQWFWQRYWNTNLYPGPE